MTTTLDAIDLSKLPPPSAVETLDFEAIVAAYKTSLIEGDAGLGIVGDPDLADALALESEPLTKLIEAGAYRELLLRNRVNQAVLSVLLAYAVGPDLDQAAANLGVVRQVGEADDRFRARAVLGPESWSTAGPVGAYIAQTLDASIKVSDVAVSSPLPGVVRVAVLSTDPSGVADADLLATVAAALNADDVRPLTDQVQVVSAAIDTFDVTAALTVGSGPDAGNVQAAAAAAVQAYAAGRRKLGATITRAGLIGALVQPGVENVALDAPATDLPGQFETAPVLGALTVTVGSA